MDWEGYNNIAIKINRKIKSGTNNEDAWNQVMEDQNLYGKANDVVSDRFTISKILDGKFKIKYKDDFIRNNPK